MGITERRDGAVLHLQFPHPAVNALSVGAGLVGALHQSVTGALVDPQVETIVFSGGGGRFSAGADIHDSDDRLDLVERLRDLFNAVEQSTKPVIAVIEGLCMGGGLELAIAAHRSLPATRW